MSHAQSQDRKFRLTAAELVLLVCWIGAVILLVLFVAVAAVGLVRQRAAAAQFQERLADERMLRQATQAKAAQAAAAKARLRAAQSEKTAIRDSAVSSQK